MAAGSASNKKAFFTLWFGQFLSILATDNTKFALRVWTYNKTGSVTQYALITFFSEMPSLILSPLTGALVDRFDRKKVMIVSDTLAALSTITIYLLMLSGNLPLWYIYVANAWSSIMNSFQWPAFTASVSLLVDKEEFVKYGAFNQFTPALSMLLGPAITGTLMKVVGLEGIFLMEMASFLLATIITMFTFIPRPTAQSIDTKAPNLWSEITIAYKWIAERPATLALLCYLANSHFTVGIVTVLMTPLIMNLSGSEKVLGLTLTLSGTGAMFGSIILYFWGGPKRRVFGVLSCAIFQGLLLALCGMIQSSTFVLAAAFSYMFFIPLVRVCRESIWQRKTPPEMQGRIFSLQRTISQLALPIAAVLSGPLADLYFEPALAKGGSLEPFLAPLVGSGRGRGAALLFVITGLFNTCAAIAGFLYSPLRRIDLDLPDAVIAPKKEN